MASAVISASVATLLRFPAVEVTAATAEYLMGRVTVVSIPFLSTNVTFRIAVSESFTCFGGVSVTLELLGIIIPSSPKAGWVISTFQTPFVSAEARVCISVPVPLSLVTVAAMDV